MRTELNYRELFNRIGHSGEQFDDDWVESIEEKIRAEGDIVGRHEWDSGGPGAGAGVEYVYRFRELYFSQDDTGMFGPYNSFTEAADAVGLLTVNEATTELWVDSRYRGKIEKS